MSASALETERLLVQHRSALGLVDPGSARKIREIGKLGIDGTGPHVKALAHKILSGFVAAPITGGVMLGLPRGYDSESVGASQRKAMREIGLIAVTSAEPQARVDAIVELEKVLNAPTVIKENHLAAIWEIDFIARQSLGSDEVFEASIRVLDWYRRSENARFGYEGHNRHRVARMLAAERISALNTLKQEHEKRKQ